MIFETDFIDLISLLNNHRAKFVLVGGLAVVIHGLFRTTKDMDLFYEGTEENCKRVLSAINEFGFKSLRLSIDDLMDEDGYIQIGYEPVRIDLFNKLPGVDFAEVYKSAIEHTESEVSFKVIHVTHLLQNKKTVARLQDLDDVKKLQKLIDKKNKPKGR